MPKMSYLRAAHRIAPTEGSVEWCEQLVQSYEDRRDEVVGRSWDAIDSLLHRRVFSGNSIDPEDLQSNCVEPPRINQITNLIVSTLFNRRPKMSVQPTTVDYEEIAEAFTTLLNNDWNRDYSMVRQSKLCVQDAAQKGMGIMYTIAEADFGAATRARRRRLRETGKLRDNMMLGVAEPDDRTIPGGLDWAETGVENDDLQRVGRIGSRRIDPRRVFFDWTAGSESSLAFVGRSYYVTPSSVARQMHWNAEAKEQIKFGAFDPDDFLQNVDGDPYQRALVREGWFVTPEGKFDLRIWWADAPPGSPFLYAPDEPPLEYGHPFRFLRWSDTGSMMWAPSDILTVYQAIVMERHLLTRWYDAMMRQGVDVNLVDGEVVTEDQLSPVEVEGVGLLLRLQGMSGRDINQVFQRLKHDPVSPEVLQYLALIERQIQDGLGLGVNQMGQYGKSETSATEAQSVKEYSDVRWAPRHAAMEEFMAGVSHDRARQHIQFGDESMIAALAGPDAARVLTAAHLTPGDVQWGLHVQVVPGSMQPPSEERKIAALSDIMTRVMSGDPLAPQMLNVPMIWLEYFKMLGFNEGSKFLMPGVTAQSIALMAQAVVQQGAGGGGSAPATPGQSNSAGLRVA